MFILDFAEKKIGELNLKTYMQKVLKGEIAVLYGENNSGKTLFLEMFAGYYKPSKGSIELNGIKSTHQKIYSSKIGYVSTENDLYEDFKVIDQINLVKSGNKKSNNDLGKIYRWFNQFFAINKLENIKVGNLSKSQKQILKLFLAIINSPSLLILDDIFDSLDNNNFQNLIIFLKELQARNISIIFSTGSLFNLQRLHSYSFINKYFHLESGEIKRSFASDYFKKYSLEKV